MFTPAITYYRFDSRTGMRTYVAVPRPVSMSDGTGTTVEESIKARVIFDQRYFTKKGEPRKTIKVKGKKFYICM